MRRVMVKPLPPQSEWLDPSKLPELSGEEAVTPGSVYSDLKNRNRPLKCCHVGGTRGRRVTPELFINAAW